MERWEQMTPEGRERLRQGLKSGGPLDNDSRFGINLSNEPIAAICNIDVAVEIESNVCGKV